MLKNLLVLILTVSLFFVINAEYGISDNNDACDVQLTLSGNGSTTATVTAKNLTTGTTYNVPQFPKVSQNSYFLCSGALNTSHPHKLYVCTQVGGTHYHAYSGTFYPTQPNSVISLTTESGICDNED